MSESWVKVAAAPDESVALLMEGVLKDAGIPSLIQRAAGFDAPDFLAAGPRDVLVPASLVEEAKQILEDTTGLGSYAPERCCGSLATSENSSTPRLVNSS
jgi:hypothetical protein